jgi:hypothetical protein
LPNFDALGGLVGATPGWRDETRVRGSDQLTGTLDVRADQLAGGLDDFPVDDDGVDVGGAGVRAAR